MSRPTVCATLLVLALLSLPACTTGITRAECQADYQELLQEIESNRITAIMQIDRQLVRTSSIIRRDELIELREIARDSEETQCGQAYQILRDCRVASG